MRVLVPLLLVFWLPRPAAAESPDALAAAAIAANPGIAALEARVSELERRSQVAGSWTDPVLMVELSNLPVDRLALGGHAMAGVQLKAQQVLPAPGVMGARRAAAEAEIAVAAAGVEEARLALEGQVRMAFWELAQVRVLRGLTEQHVAQTESLVAAVRARYEVGRAGQHALVRLELRRDQLRDELGDFDRAERALLGGLAAAVHQPMGLRVDTPTEISARPVEGAHDVWLSQADRQRPVLRQLGLAAEAARMAARLAVVDARPDVSVWAGYRVRTVQTELDPGTDLVSLGLGLPLPMASARRGAGLRGAALERAHMATAQRAAALDSISGELEGALAHWSRANEKVRAHDQTLLPAARRVLETTLADYRVDKADFASLYGSEVQLLNLERARVQAATDSHIQAVRVHTLAGAALSPTEASP